MQTMLQNQQQTEMTKHLIPVGCDTTSGMLCLNTTFTLSDPYRLPNMGLNTFAPVKTNGEEQKLRGATVYNQTPQGKVMSKKKLPPAQPST